jgi:hypothetical protein
MFVSWLRWGLFALALAGLALALYSWLPFEPRWVVRGPIVPLGLAADGKTFITATWREEDLPSKPNFAPATDPTMVPVQFWDIASGKKVWSVLGESGPRWQVAISEDRRHLAAIAPAFDGAGQDELCTIDLTTGRERRTLIDHLTDEGSLHFSPGGELLLLQAHDPDRNWTERYLYLFDAASLRLVAKVQPSNQSSRSSRLSRLWSADGKALLTFTTDASGNASLRRNAADGETLTSLKGAGEWLAITPDGKTLLTDPPKADADNEEPTDTILLWDLPAGTRRGTIPISGSWRAIAGKEPFVTPDRRTLLITTELPGPKYEVAAWDIDTVNCLGKALVGNPIREDTEMLLPDANTFVLAYRDDWARIAAYRIRPFCKLWQHNALSASPILEVLPGMERLVVFSGEGGADRLQLLDVQTGTPTLDLPLNPRGQHELISRGTHFAVVTRYLGPDDRGLNRELIEKHLLALFIPMPQPGRDTPTSTRLIDLATGAERCRIDHAGADPQAISTDGRSLLLYQQAGPDSEAALICYDVPPSRPWAPILGIPLLVGVALVLTRTVWRRLRRKVRGAP